VVRRRKISGQAWSFYGNAPRWNADNTYRRDPIQRIISLNFVSLRFFLGHMFRMKDADW
jgi:hypothetical protein